MTWIRQAGGESRRVARERRTVAAMIRVYCHGRHGLRDGLCVACSRLHEYAMTRLEHCPFGDDKPTCAQCPVHCYKSDLREQIREVMRYAGPRMLWRHPWLAVRHLLDGRKPAPAAPPRKRPAGSAAPEQSG